MSDALKKIGLVASSFDILHPGYLLMFKEAKQHCDYLITFLHKDPTAERPHKNKPILSVEDRAFALESNRYVDKIIIYETEEDLYRHLLGYSSADNVIRFLGDDYKNAENYTGKDLNIPIVWISRDHGWSLTKLREKIIKSTERSPDDDIKLQEALLKEMRKVATASKSNFDKKFAIELYNTMSSESTSTKTQNIDILSSVDVATLKKLYGLAKGWWLPVSPDKNVFLNFGDWQLYYSLSTASNNV